MSDGVPVRPSPQQPQHTLGPSKPSFHPGAVLLRAPTPASCSGSECTVIPGASIVRSHSPAATAATPTPTAAAPVPATPAAISAQAFLQSGGGANGALTFHLLLRKHKALPRSFGVDLRLSSDGSQLCFSSRSFHPLTLAPLPLGSDPPVVLVPVGDLVDACEGIFDASAALLEKHTRKCASFHSCHSFTLFFSHLEQTNKLARSYAPPAAHHAPQARGFPTPFYFEAPSVDSMQAWVRAMHWLKEHAASHASPEERRQQLVRMHHNSSLNQRATHSQSSSTSSVLVHTSGMPELTPPLVHSHSLNSNVTSTSSSQLTHPHHPTHTPAASSAFSFSDAIKARLSSAFHHHSASASASSPSALPPPASPFQHLHTDLARAQLDPELGSPEAEEMLLAAATPHALPGAASPAAAVAAAASPPPLGHAASSPARVRITPFSKADAFTSLLSHGQAFLAFQSRSLSQPPELVFLWTTPDLNLIYVGSTRSKPSQMFPASAITSIDSGVTSLVFGLAKWCFTLVMRVPKDSVKAGRTVFDTLRSHRHGGSWSGMPTAPVPNETTLDGGTCLLSLHLAASCQQTLKLWLAGLKYLRDLKSSISAPFGVHRVAWMDSDMNWRGSDLLRMFGIESRETLVKLGGGGMANVYRVAHTATKQQFALKVYHHYPEVIRHEIEIMKELRHANCISYFGCIPRGQDLYVIMEYADLGSLSDFLKTKAKEKMKEAHIAYILKQVLLALQYLHSLSMIHRDIKAANILLTSKGQVKLCVAYGTEVLLSTGEVILAQHLTSAHRLVSPSGSALEIQHLDKTGVSETMYTIRPSADFQEHSVTPNHIIAYRKLDDGGAWIDKQDSAANMHDLFEQADESTRTSGYRLYKPRVALELPHTGTLDGGWLAQCLDQTLHADTTIHGSSDPAIPSSGAALDHLINDLTSSLITAIETDAVLPSWIDGRAYADLRRGAEDYEEPILTTNEVATLRESINGSVSPADRAMIRDRITQVLLKLTSWWVGVWVAGGDLGISQSLDGRSHAGVLSRCHRLMDMLGGEEYRVLSALLASMGIDRDNKTTVWTQAVLGRFMTEPLAVRRAFLCGLTDGDGDVVKTENYSIVAAVPKEHLVRVTTFIRMLGLKAHPPVLDTRGKAQSYELKFSHDRSAYLKETMSMLCVSSKRLLMSDEDHVSEDMFQTCFDVKPAAKDVSRQYVTFQVKGGLYLLGDLTVTHNCDFGISEHFVDKHQLSSSASAAAAAAISPTPALSSLSTTMMSPTPSYDLSMLASPTSSLPGSTPTPHHAVHVQPPPVLFVGTNTGSSSISATTTGTCNGGGSGSGSGSGTGTGTSNGVGIGGSPLFMSPEAMQGGVLLLHPSSDIWSLGITAIEIAEGRPPHHDLRTLFAVCQAVLTNPSPSLAQHARSFPNPSEAFTDFVDRCLAKEPTERATVEQLLAHPFIMGAAMSSTSTPSATANATGTCPVSTGVVASARSLLMRGAQMLTASFSSHNLSPAREAAAAREREHGASTPVAHVERNSISSSLITPSPLRRSLGGGGGGGGGGASTTTSVSASVPSSAANSPHNSLPPSPATIVATSNRAPPSLTLTSSVSASAVVGVGSGGGGPRPSSWTADTSSSPLSGDSAASFAPTTRWPLHVASGLGLASAPRSTAGTPTHTDDVHAISGGGLATGLKKENRGSLQLGLPSFGSGTPNKLAANLLAKSANSSPHLSPSTSNSNLSIYTLNGTPTTVPPSPAHTPAVTAPDEPDEAFVSFLQHGAYTRARFKVNKLLGSTNSPHDGPHASPSLGPEASPEDTRRNNNAHRHSGGGGGGTPFQLKKQPNERQLVLQTSEDEQLTLKEALEAQNRNFQLSPPSLLVRATVEQHRRHASTLVTSSSAASSNAPPPHLRHHTRQFSQLPKLLPRLTLKRTASMSTVAAFEKAVEGDSSGDFVSLSPAPMVRNFTSPPAATLLRRVASVIFEGDEAETSEITAPHSARPNISRSQSMLRKFSAATAMQPPSRSDSTPGSLMRQLSMESRANSTPGASDDPSGELSGVPSPRSLQRDSSYSHSYVSGPPAFLKPLALTARERLEPEDEVDENAASAFVRPTLRVMSLSGDDDEDGTDQAAGEEDACDDDPFSFERRTLKRRSSLNQGDGGGGMGDDMNASYIISSHGTLLAGGFAISAQGLHAATDGSSSRRTSLLESKRNPNVVITPEDESDPGYDPSAEPVPVPSPTSREHALSKSDLFTLGVIGKGQNGPVLKAIHLPSLTRVALKSIYAHDRGTRHQLLHELTAYLRFDSPYLVSFLGAYYEDSVIFLATEYMDQGSLQHFIKRSGPLATKPRVFRQIAYQCISGLKHMHDAFTLHRDVKPENILCDHNALCKISDFGLLKDLGPDAMCQTFLGTMSYLAPERITSGEYSYPSDVWAMGLSFIYALTGQGPRQSSDFFTMMDLVTKHPPELLTPATHGLEEQLCDFVNSMLKMEASERATCDQLLAHPFLLGPLGDESVIPQTHLASDPDSDVWAVREDNLVDLDTILELMFQNHLLPELQAKQESLGLVLTSPFGGLSSRNSNESPDGVVHETPSSVVTNDAEPLVSTNDGSYTTSLHAVPTLRLPAMRRMPTADAPIEVTEEESTIQTFPVSLASPPGGPLPATPSSSSDSFTTPASTVPPSLPSVHHDSSSEDDSDCEETIAPPLSLAKINFVRTQSLNRWVVENEGEDSDDKPTPVTPMPTIADSPNVTPLRPSPKIEAEELDLHASSIETTAIIPASPAADAIASFAPATSLIIDASDPADEETTFSSPSPRTSPRVPLSLVISPQESVECDSVGLIGVIEESPDAVSLHRPRLSVSLGLGLTLLPDDDEVGMITTAACSSTESQLGSPGLGFGLNTSSSSPLSSSTSSSSAPPIELLALDADRCECLARQFGCTPEQVQIQWAAKQREMIKRMA